MRGLSRSEVAERVARGDSNATRRTTSRPLWHIIRDNVFTLFNSILTACFLIILLVGDLRDGLFFGIVVANSLIGIVQEVRAKVTLDRLALLSAPVIAVRREGLTVILSPPDLVLDDIVVLRAGDQVVADAIVLEATDLTVNESLLTGESEPIGKSGGDIVLSGSLISSGTAFARVTAVGEASYANRLTTEIRRHSLAHSELRAATNRVLVYISWVIGPILAFVIGTRMIAYGGRLSVDSLIGLPWRSVLVDVVASVVGMIPEGLVLLISLAFGVAAVRLAGRRVLIQELAAVEILARVDVLCLDKTGTLTTGAISFLGLQGLRENGTVTDTPENEAAVNAALALFARQADANSTASSLAGSFPDLGATTVAYLPFASSRAFSLLTCQFQNETTTWLLGAPERVFARDREHRDAALHLAALGNRTLGLAALTPVATTPGMTWPGLDLAKLDLSEAKIAAVGILTFAEEIRSDAIATLEFFSAQGVRCIILSGDNPATVAAVASGLGVGTGSMDATGLTDDAKIRAALAGNSIFGRVAPDLKRSIVRVLQEDGHVVAMTGDGVNDAMAIKDADLGIAMGSGTSASRAVARLVLLDDEFARLPSVLAYGRQVIANVERVANLFLAKTVYGIILAVVFSLLLWQFPFLPRQLTLVSTLTIGIPSFFLALAPNRRIYHPGILNRLLRYALITGSIAAVVTISVHAVVRSLVGRDEARSVTTVALWIVAFWILCVLTRPLDRGRALLLATMVGLFASAVSVPGAREFFSMQVALDLPLLIAVIAGMLGAAGIEVVYRVARQRGLIFDRE